MKRAARLTPSRIGSVTQPCAASPSMSEKSLLVVAPRRNSRKIVPMNHGSRCRTLATIDHPATFKRQPRGTAIVRFAQIPKRFVRPQPGSE